MRKKILILFAVVWVLLTVLLFSMTEKMASAAPKPNVITAEQLREVLRSNPEVMLDFLNQNSEILLDIVQQGAVLRRDKAIVSGWQRDMRAPKTVALNGRPMRGSATAPVTIVAFSDFTCAYCEQAAATVKRVMATYEGKVRYVFKAFPRDEHGTGRLAAEYFVAAGLQSAEKSWDFYDRLYADRDGLMRQGETVMKEAAKAAGLDMKRLATDIKSKAVQDVLDEDLAEANRHGVEGTPTFLVNNLVVRGAVSDELFAKAVDIALTGTVPGQPASGAVPATVPVKP